MSPIVVYGSIIFLLGLGLFLLIYRPPKKEEKPQLTEEELFMQQYRERQLRERKKKQAKAARGKIGMVFFRFRSLIRESHVSAPAIGFLALVGAGAAFVLSRFLFTNLIVCVAAACIGTSFPLFLLNSRVEKAKTLLVTQLESTMRILTNAYLADGDFIRTVRQNLYQIEYVKPFKQFLLEMDMIDPDIEKALHRMDISVGNKYFSQWINLIILAQTDREMMRMLPSVCEAMNYSKTAQIKARTAMGVAWRDYFTMLMLVAAIPLVMRFSMAEWYDNLVTSPAGVVVMLATLGTVVISLIIARKIDKPIEDV